VVKLQGEINHCSTQSKKKNCTARRNSFFTVPWRNREVVRVEGKIKTKTELHRWSNM